MTDQSNDPNMAIADEPKGTLLERIAIADAKAKAASGAKMVEAPENKKTAAPEKAD